MRPGHAAGGWWGSCLLPFCLLLSRARADSVRLLLPVLACAAAASSVAAKPAWRRRPGAWLPRSALCLRHRARPGPAARRAPAGVLAVVRSLPFTSRGYETPYTGMVPIHSGKQSSCCCRLLLLLVMVPGQLQPDGWRAAFVHSCCRCAVAASRSCACPGRSLPHRTCRAHHNAPCLPPEPLPLTCLPCPLPPLPTCLPCCPALLPCSPACHAPPPPPPPPPPAGEIAEDLARYLVDSEQVQSALGLGVSIAKDLRWGRCGNVGRGHGAVSRVPPPTPGGASGASVGCGGGGGVVL